MLDSEKVEVLRKAGNWVIAYSELTNCYACGNKLSVPGRDWCHGGIHLAIKELKEAISETATSPAEEPKPGHCIHPEAPCNECCNCNSKEGPKEERDIFKAIKMVEDCYWTDGEYSNGAKNALAELERALNTGLVAQPCGGEPERIVPLRDYTPEEALIEARKIGTYIVNSLTM